MNPFLLVALGGAVGSSLRYGASVLIGRAWTGSFPLATLFVNIAGSLIMGLFIGTLARTAPVWQEEMRLLIAVGLLGGFTTFSSFSLDTVSLLERGNVGEAVLYAVLSVAVCLLGLYLGLTITRIGTP